MRHLSIRLFQFKYVIFRDDFHGGIQRTIEDIELVLCRQELFKNETRLLNINKSFCIAPNQSLEIGGGFLNQQSSSISVEVQYCNQLHLDKLFPGKNLTCAS